MHSAWYVLVRGCEPAVAGLRDVCAVSTDHSLTEEASGEWRLRSSTVPSDLDHEEAWPRLCELLVRLSDVVAAVAERRVQLTPGTLRRTRPDGNSDIFVFPEPIRLRVRAFPPMVSAGGVPAEPLEARFLRLQEANERLRLALHFLNAEPSWYSLWKAFESIGAAQGGERGLIGTGWTTRAELRRFGRTANSYSAAGDAARHALPEHPPPDKPMTVEAAEDYVRGLLSRWVTELSRSDRS
jgi:hypothetical protein